VSVAYLALVVAVCSLLWNIISWQLDRPRVRLETSMMSFTSEYKYQPKELYWCDLIIRNTSKSDVIIESIEAALKTGNLSYPCFRVPQKSEKAVKSHSSTSEEAGTGASSVPYMPFLLKEGRAEDWHFDIIKHVGKVAMESRELRAQYPFKQFIVEVRLGSGKTIKRRNRIAKIWDLDLLAKLYSERYPGRASG
jgi:hypothetical protein